MAEFAELEKLRSVNFENFVTLQTSHFDRGMVSMVSMEVSKTLGPGSSPGTPAIENVRMIVGSFERRKYRVRSC